MKNKILTASDMGKLSHQKMKERLGEEGYREMQKNKSMKAKVARALKKTVDNLVVEQTVDSKIKE
jgi:hypothetical protein